MRAIRNSPIESWGQRAGGAPVIAASNTWRRLKGTNQLPKLIVGARFNGGIEVIQLPENRAA